MDFDLTKIEKAIANGEKLDFTKEQIEYMANIYNAVVNSSNSKDIIEDLAILNNMSVSDIKFIRNIYFMYYATVEEKNNYIKRNNKKR